MGNGCCAGKAAGRGDSGAIAFKSRESSTSRGADVIGRNQGPVSEPSELCSSRIENMLARRGEFASELEYRTAHSRVHWSELSREGTSDGEEPGSDHRQYFQKLQKDAHWGRFCSRVKEVKLGRKLGEGAQADIYEAQVTFVTKFRWSEKKVRGYVAKVMKADCALEDLQRQWPRGIGSLNKSEVLLELYGALVKEPGTERNKFGFVIKKYWGDLRSLIDLHLERQNGKGPPFSLPQAKFLMYWIARDMRDLHKRGIIHRDLKSSNVLIRHAKMNSNILWILPYVADWECSLGVVGTGFWRAPEILQQLKEKRSMSEVVFNEKADVYSFAMTCYEIATGVIPFEGWVPYSETRDAVLQGARPELPPGLDRGIRNMIVSCWDPNPALRPSFDELHSIVLSRR